MRIFPHQYLTRKHQILVTLLVFLGLKMGPGSPIIAPPGDGLLGQKLPKLCRLKKPLGWGDLPSGSVDPPGLGCPT